VSKLATALEQLRDMPDEELRAALVRTRDEVFRIKLGMHTNQVASPAELEIKRRDIAKIQTILRARELGLETQAQRRKAAAKKSAK